MPSVYKPAGRKTYRIQFIDQHGERQIKGTLMKDKRVAEALAQTVENDAARIRAGLLPQFPETSGPYLGLEGKAPPRALEEAIDEYLADLDRQGASPATLKHRKKQLHFLRRTAEWASVNDMTVEAITRRLSEMATAGRSTATTNAYRDSLNAFLEWCLDQNVIEENHARRVKPAKNGAVRPSRRRPFTPEELQRLIGVSERYRDYYTTAVLTGLRLKELSLVERRDFDLAARVWVCRPEVDKMNTAWRLPLVPEVVPVLERVCAGLKPGDRLFPEQQSNATFNKHLKLAGIEKVIDGRRVNFHALRYTFCTLLAGKLPLKTVQRLMRHASLKHTADLYLELGLDSMLDQVTELPNLLG